MNTQTKREQFAFARPFEIKWSLSDKHQHSNEMPYETEIHEAKAGDKSNEKSHKSERLKKSKGVKKCAREKRMKIRNIDWNLIGHNPLSILRTSSSITSISWLFCWNFFPFADFILCCIACLVFHLQADFFFILIFLSIINYTPSFCVYTRQFLSSRCCCCC